jgi:hypothetical protein
MNSSAELFYSVFSTVYHPITKCLTHYDQAMLFTTTTATKITELSFIFLIAIITRERKVLPKYLVHMLKQQNSKQNSGTLATECKTAPLNKQVRCLTCIALPVIQ